jgi:hypothetical protein
VTDARSFIAPVPGGYVVLQPVALSEGRLAVNEVYVPAAEASHRMTSSGAVMTAVALALISVSVLVADRLATRVTRPTRRAGGERVREQRRRRAGLDRGRPDDRGDRRVPKDAALRPGPSPGRAASPGGFAKETEVC